MKTYKQPLLQSSIFIITIVALIILLLTCSILGILIWDLSFLGVIWPPILFMVGMTLINFSQLWYIVIDEKAFWVNNGVYGLCENLFRYETLYQVNFGSSIWYGLYITILMNDNRKKVYPLLLVKSNDVKMIIQDLEAHGVSVDISKLSQKYK